MYYVLAYYYIGHIEDPQGEVLKHKEFFQARDFKGRIYISEQGINGQSSGLEKDAIEYMEWLKRDSRFKNVGYKIHLSTKHEFPKMTVKVRNQLVAVDCEVDFSKIGERISPREWKEKLENRDEDTIVLDVRNNYETVIGHFEGAELPNLESFREFPEYTLELKKTRDPKKTKVMMYCTGGIRCEFYSAIMKQEGFETIYQLDGGVIGYGLDEGSDHWKGKLFVFDDRLAVPIAHDESEVISNCSHCKTACDSYHNCANMDCNRLFLSCVHCLKKHHGCCSSNCFETGRIRPYREDGIPFRKFSYEEKTALKSTVSSSCSF